MIDRFLADAVLSAHLLFIIFVMVGGVVAIRFRWVAALHVPAVAWGIFVELSGRICPLTAIENKFREAAGSAGYTGGFIEHYLVPVIYPEGLTRHVQVLLAGVVISANVAVYGYQYYRLRRH